MTEDARIDHAVVAGRSTPTGNGAVIDRAFASSHTLAKPTRPICNLDWEYRFFLSEETRYPGDRFRLADELLGTGSPPPSMTR